MLHIHLHTYVLYEIPHIQSLPVHQQPDNKIEIAIIKKQAIIQKLKQEQRGRVRLWWA